jgi:hypothetical protein
MVRILGILGNLTLEGDKTAPRVFLALCGAVLETGA